MMWDDTNSGDAQPDNRKPIVHRVKVCPVGGCPDPDKRGHLNECPISAVWVAPIGDSEIETYLMLNAHIVGMEAALESRDYDARRN